jgi:transforming growth factor-beta-induced protein
LSATSEPGLTVFAPTNAAFSQFEADLVAKKVITKLDDLTREQWKPILLYHLLNKKLEATGASAAAGAGTTIPFADGSELGDLGGSVKLSLVAEKIKIDGRASIVEFDIQATNGVGHGIDTVLLPSMLDVWTADGRFSRLISAIKLSGDVELLQRSDVDTFNFTVLAPTNMAFDGLVASLKGADNGQRTGISNFTNFTTSQLEQIVQYHLIRRSLFTPEICGPTPS